MLEVTPLLNWNLGLVNVGHEMVTLLVKLGRKGSLMTSSVTVAVLVMAFPLSVSIIWTDLSLRSSSSSNEVISVSSSMLQEISRPIRNMDNKRNIGWGFLKY